MSFDIFVQCFKQKQPSTYDRRIAEEIFNRDAIDPTTPLSVVRYLDGYANIDGAEEDQIDGLVLSRFGGRTALERLLELASTTGSLIVWPSNEINMAVTSAEMLTHLPDELTQAGEEIAVVQSVDEFIDVADLVFL